MVDEEEVDAAEYHDDESEGVDLDDLEGNVRHAMALTASGESM